MRRDEKTLNGKRGDEMRRQLKNKDYKRVLVVKNAYEIRSELTR
jgi:hypothetical protein